MLKARSGKTLIFGLSAKNIELLMQGRPISFDLSDIGATGRVLIFYGRTEQEMKEDLMNQVERKKCT